MGTHQDRSSRVTQHLGVQQPSEEFLWVLVWSPKALQKLFLKYQLRGKQSKSGLMIRRQFSVHHGKKVELQVLDLLQGRQLKHHGKMDQRQPVLLPLSERQKLHRKQLLHRLPKLLVKLLRTVDLLFLVLRKGQGNRFLWLMKKQNQHLIRMRLKQT